MAFVHTVFPLIYPSTRIQVYIRMYGFEHLFVYVLYCRYVDPYSMYICSLHILYLHRCYMSVLRAWRPLSKYPETNMSVFSSTLLEFLSKTALIVVFW